MGVGKQERRKDGEKEMRHRETGRRKAETGREKHRKDGGIEVAEGAEEGDVTQIGSLTAAAAE